MASAKVLRLVWMSNRSTGSPRIVMNLQELSGFRMANRRCSTASKRSVDPAFHVFVLPHPYANYLPVTCSGYCSLDRSSGGGARPKLHPEHSQIRQAYSRPETQSRRREGDSEASPGQGQEVFLSGLSNRSE